MRYETLRGQVLQRQLLADRLGLGILRLQGLAAWIMQWSKLSARTAPPAAESPRPPVLPDKIHADVINVLAAMAIGHLPEVHV